MAEAALVNPLLRKASFSLVALAAGSFLVLSPPAHAKGCLKGAAVGGVAGHVAGHHGILGAGAGCLVGRHHAKQQAQETQAQQRRDEEARTRAQPREAQTHGGLVTPTRRDPV